MALPALPSISQLIRLYGLSARQQLSQNFILDLQLTDRLARHAARPRRSLRGCAVLEVGAGPGSLTRSLLREGASVVVAVEKDRRFVPVLEQLRDAVARAPQRRQHVEVVFGDAMETDERALLLDAVRRARAALGSATARTPDSSATPRSASVSTTPSRPHSSCVPVSPASSRSASSGRTATTSSPALSSPPPGSTLAASLPPAPPTSLHDDGNNGTSDNDSDSSADVAHAHSVLDHDEASWPPWSDENALPPLRIIGNLPYSVGTALLVKWTHEAASRRGVFALGRVPLTLTFQAEVADRLVARVGTTAYGRLSVLVQHVMQPSMCFTLHPHCFVPPPKVTSRAVTLVPRAQPAGGADTPIDALEHVSRQLWSQRRKQLSTVLRGLGWPAEPFLQTLTEPHGVVSRFNAPAASLDAAARLRPEDISVEQYAAMARVYATLPSKPVERR